MPKYSSFKASLLLIGGAICIGTDHDILSQSAEPGLPANKPVAAVAVDPLRAALERRVTLDFDGQPLNAVLASIGKTEGVNILLDRKSLEDANTDADKLVTIQVVDLKLRSALKLLLRPLELMFESDDEVLRVMTTDGVRVHTKAHDVSDLIANRDSSGEFQGYDYDSMIELLTTTVAPSTWGDGNDTIPGFAAMLVFSQTEEVHDEVSALLAALRRVQTQQSLAPLWLRDSETIDSIRKGLDKRVSLHFEKTPLNEVIAQLRTKFNLPLKLDTRSLEDAAYNVDEARVSLAVDSIPLRIALDQMLDSCDLGYCYQDDEHLWLGSREWAATNMLIRVYPARDLIAADAAGESVPEYRGNDKLADLIRGTIAETTWGESNGPGSIAVEHQTGCLVCSQTLVVHWQIEKLLGQLRATQKEQVARGAAVAVNRQQLITRVYHLSTSRTYRFPATPATLNPDPMAWVTHNPFAAPATLPSAPEPQTVDVPIPRDDCNEIARFMRETIEPKSWQREGAYLKVVAGKLVVHQTYDIQRRVEQMLSQLGVRTSGASGGGAGFF